jgi:uncharacterized protein
VGVPPPAPALELEVLAEPHALLRMEPGEGTPDWLTGAAPPGAIVSISRTAEELSVVCPERLVPASHPHEGGRRALRVAGTLEHSLTGILVAIAAPLAAAGIPIFAIATWDTDYLLVDDDDLGRAAAALREAGHTVVGAAGS